MITSGQGSTRQRLADAGLRLFAERGFDSVSVGDIEQAVGLVPRRGALYRHFASKAELLADAVESHLHSIEQARVQFVGDGSGPSPSPDEVGRWVLSEMDRQHAVTQVLERDAARLPELRDRFRTGISDAGFAGMSAILRGWLAGRDVDIDIDIDAAAVVLLGALVNLRRSTWTLAATPLGLDDDRVVTEWARICRLATS